MANSRLCSIQDCGKKHYGRGYCCAHWERWNRHGDPLGGRLTFDGEPLRFILEVAMQHTSGECLTWPFSKNEKGYAKIRIDGKHLFVNRYICEIVHGVPPTPDHEAAHSCGKGHEACIAPGHLEWKTHTENMADKLSHGTHNRGERHGNAKLTEAEAREILAMKGVETQYNLAKRFLVSQGAIASIHAGIRWAWLSN